MRISDWSSDVCSSDLFSPGFAVGGRRPAAGAGYDRRDLDQFHAAARRLWLGNTGAADSVHGVYGHGDHRFATEPVIDRKSGVVGKSVSVSVDLGGGRIIKKKNRESKEQIIKKE